MEFTPISTSGKLIRMDEGLCFCECGNLRPKFSMCFSCKKPHKLSRLGEVIKSSRPRIMTPMIDGNFELVFRDKNTGQLKRKIGYNNVATTFVQEFIGNNKTIGDLYIVITNDDTPMHTLKTVSRSTMETPNAASASKVKDYSLQTWTYSTSFAAPTLASRSVSFVGLAVDHMETSTYGHITSRLITGKLLTTIEEQTTSDLLEIVYRLTLRRGT